VMLPRGAGEREGITKKDGWRKLDGGLWGGDDVLSSEKEKNNGCWKAGGLFWLKNGQKGSDLLGEATH